MFDTICAVSTPRGVGGVAMIRISGPEAIEVGERIFRPKSGRAVADTESRYAVYGDILSPAEDGYMRVCDDGLLTVFRAPGSFTGEDTVEICCHGGALVTEYVLRAALCSGARQAEAGEFTRRAFINGRLTLSRAESLGLLLEAKTDAQLWLSRGGMTGRISEAVGALTDGLYALIADIYARLDFPEEDLGSISEEEIIERARALSNELSALIATYRTGRAVASGISTVICGRTNAGKSSLYNALLGREAAIVTDIEGTTRDTLSETASLGGVTLKLFDTAGIRKNASDAVEQIGIGRALEHISDAELILFLIDGSRPVSEDDLLLADEVTNASGEVIALLGKSDLGEPDASSLELFSSFELGVTVSTVSGEGLSELSRLISELYIDGSLSLGRDAVVTNARQFAALSAAHSAICSAIDALEGGFPPDLCGVELERAISALCEIDGRAVAEDVVAGIFSKFCVGK